MEAKLKKEPKKETKKKEPKKEPQQSNNSNTKSLKKRGISKALLEKMGIGKSKGNCKENNKKCLQDQVSKTNKNSSEYNKLYYKPEKMGFLMGIDGNSVFNKRGFKKRCISGVKYKKKNEVPIKNKKNFGTLLGQLPKLMYVRKEREEECYDPEPRKEMRLELGEKCIDDKQCKTFKCSSNKFLRIPGKCIKKESENLYSDGDYCLSDKECKKGLKCKKGVLTSKIGYGVCKSSPKNIKKKLLSLGDKNYKNNNSDNIDSYLKKYNGKTGINKFLKSSDKNRNIDNVSQKEIEKNIIQNDDYYWKYMLDDDKEKIDCVKSSECSKLNDNGFCYKDKCINVYNKCNKDKAVSCLKNRLKASKKKECCDYDSICLEDINDRTKAKINVCYPLENYTKKLRNGHYCQVDSNCKSNKCRKTHPNGITKKCISPYISGERKCVNHSDCTDDNIYNDDSDICVNKRCVNLKDYSYDEKKDEYFSGDLKLLDRCLDSQQCKSKYCGTKDFRLPEFYKHLDHKLCIPERGTNEINKKIQNKKKMYRENIKFNIKDFNSTDYNNFNLKDYNCIFYNDNRLSYGNNNNKLIIFRKNNKYYLGKLIINNSDNYNINGGAVKFSNNSDNSYNSEYNSEVTGSYEILYFKGNVSVDNNMFKNFYVISDNRNNYFSRDFEERGNSENIESGLKNILKKRFEVNNLFIFEYICFKIFGKRIFAKNFDNAFDKYTNSDEKYFTLKDFNYNIHLNKSYTKPNKRNEFMIYETYLKDDIFNLSIPFRFISKNQIKEVSKSKDNLDFYDISNKIRESNYIDLNESDYNKIINYNHISYMDVINKFSEIKSKYSSDIRDFPEITQFSIFK